MVRRQSPSNAALAARTLRCLCGAGVLASVAAGVAGAQPTPPRRGNNWTCDGRIISELVISPRGPFLDGAIYDRLRFLTRIGRAVHTTTREDVVRRFLAFGEGERCSEVRRAESERVLRAQPFIADADVIALPDGRGGVRVEVITVDEFSPIIGGSVSGGISSPELSGLKLGTLNLMGDGVSVLGEWQQGGFYRDLWALRATDYQVLGRPYQLSLAGARRQLGSGWETDLSHPFYTDLQRVAWRISAGESDSYIEFLRPEAPVLSLSSLRRWLDVGGVVRIGVPGRLSIFGASLSRELESPGAEPVMITDSGVVVDTSQALIGRYARHRSARINALWGVRSIGFLRVQGFDALSATQDVRTGFQLGTLFGRGLSAAGAQDDDIFVSMDLYTGWGSKRSFIAMQVQGEGRQDYDRNRWDGVLGSGKAAWYVKPSFQQTTILTAEFGGGWRQRAPFQLALGEPLGGVRGYRDSRAAGARRIVARLEQRWTPPPFSRHAAIGFAAFADAGRMWAGDAPYGLDTPVNSSAGLSVLAAVPPRSRRLWRLDVAFPFGEQREGKWELRLSSSDPTRRFWDEPADVKRGRERSTPASVFRWP